MATYSAVASLNLCFSGFLHNYDAALDPDDLKLFELAYKEVKSFQDFVERLDSRSRNRMSASLQQVTLEALDLLDLILNEDDDCFDDIVEKMHSLMETLKKTKLESEGQINVSSSSSNVVGLRNVRIDLKLALTLSLRAMPTNYFLLHGMAGIGKTTLAREVFEDLDICEWYENRVWVRVGPERKPEDIMQAILAQLNPAEMVMGGDEAEEEAAQRLNQLLKDKRCLVVLDDVWNNHNVDDDWYRFFGELHGSSESRVLITSRITHIDYFRKASDWNIIKMRLLNAEESWDLLRAKAFDGGPCPRQLEKAGKEIAKKCDGLPLTIVMVAELLSKAQESLWIDVAAQRKHQLFVDAYDQISKVLDPSYKELIDELKLCFLYMGVFPLKTKIRRTKLINLWAVEDIFYPTVKPSELYHHDLESLKYLDFCSLLMVYEKSSTYFDDPPTLAIRTCGLHSSWWHFCQRQARKTNFFYVLDGPEDGLNEEGIKGQTRLSIHHNVLFAYKDVYNSMEENCASTAESLLCFGPYHQYEVPICFGLKLLQRLDALNIRFYDFPSEVVELMKLRYLALTCNGKLPPSISKLRRLQFLIVHPHLRIKSSGAPSYMPVEIWDLEELEHLQVLGSDLPDFGDKSLGMLSTLLDVSTASCNVLYRLPNLKKLKIRIELTPDAADPLCFSDHISNMINLESFKCVVVNPGCKFDQVVPPVASFPVLPSSLKKLSLSGMGYPWEEMREIALLPCLQQLKLRCNAFQGRNWQVEEEGFPSLYFLLMEDIDLVKLVGSFRSLMHLSIKHCYKLEEIQFTDGFDVAMIELDDSNPLVEMSIKTSMLESGSKIPPFISVNYSWKPARESMYGRILTGTFDLACMRLENPFSKVVEWVPSVGRVMFVYYQRARVGSCVCENKTSDAS